MLKRQVAWHDDDSGKRAVVDGGGEEAPSLSLEESDTETIRLFRYTYIMLMPLVGSSSSGREGEKGEGWR